MSISLSTIAVLAMLGLLGVGLYGLLAVRNLIKLIVALQILVKAAVLGLILAGHINGRMNLSQSLAITVIVADTIVAVVGLALAVQIRRRLGTLDIKELGKLRG